MCNLLQIVEPIPTNFYSNHELKKIFVISIRKYYTLQGFDNLMF